MSERNRKLLCCAVPLAVWRFRPCQLSIYPFLKEDCFVDVTDAAQVFLLTDHQKNNYRLWTYRYKAYYSLDRGDGIENDAIHTAAAPEEIFLRKVSL